MITEGNGIRHAACGMQLEFRRLGRHRVTGRFDGGHMSSDDGGLLLREVDRRIGPTARLAACFVDYRHPASVEQDLSTLLAQRVHALALGYEDLNDHDALRRDVLLSLATEQADPTGAARVRARDRGAALASSSTLNRLELGDLERGDLAAAPSALHVDPRTSPGTSACDAPADPRPAHGS